MKRPGAIAPGRVFYSRTFGKAFVYDTAKYIQALRREERT